MISLTMGILSYITKGNRDLCRLWLEVPVLFTSLVIRCAEFESFKV